MLCMPRVGCFFATDTADADGVEQARQRGQHPPSPWSRFQTVHFYKAVVRSCSPAPVVPV